MSVLHNVTHGTDIPGRATPSGARGRIDARPRRAGASAPTGPQRNRDPEGGSTEGPYLERYGPSVNRWGSAESDQLWPPASFSRSAASASSEASAPDWSPPSEEYEPPPPDAAGATSSPPSAAAFSSASRDLMTCAWCCSKRCCASAYWVSHASRWVS